MARASRSSSARRPLSALFLLISCAARCRRRSPRRAAHRRRPASSSTTSARRSAGARVTVSDDGGVRRPDDVDRCGRARSRCSDSLPGTYSSLVEMTLFSPATQRVDRAGVRIGARRFASCSRPADSPRASSSPPGAWRPAWPRRRRRSRSSTPPTSSASVAADLTDVLKKNAGVDVVQYSGALSGIGIRGFRPQFSGINKRSLLLIDGRPSGVTNLATLLLDNVERIEVLKGAASAVYGSSAMGGVVNVITRQSRGKIGGNARVGGGSFGDIGVRRRASAATSSSRVDFDVTGNAFDQRDDYPHGQRRGAAGDELQDLRRHRARRCRSRRAPGASTAAPTAIAGATS